MCEYIGAVHFGQFRLSTAGDLLRPQLYGLLFEIIELLLQFIFVLAPELRSLDFGCRLRNLCQPSITIVYLYKMLHTIVSDCVAVCREVLLLLVCKSPLVCKIERVEWMPRVCSPTLSIVLTCQKSQSHPNQRARKMRFHRSAKISIIQRCQA